MREKLLNELISLEKPIGETFSNLKKLEWDSDVEVELTHEKFIKILKKFVDNKIDANTLEEWANCIEGRDDISYDALGLKVIHHLANPELEGIIDVEQAMKYIDELS